MATPEVPLGWAPDSLPLHSHICFYYSDERTLRDSMEFVRIGLDAPHEFNVIFADQGRHAELMSWLGEGYPGSVEDAVTAGKLALVGGAPDRVQLLTNIGQVLGDAVARGHRLIRFLGFIAWGAPGWPSEDQLLEFESEVNDAVTAFPAVIVCTYGVPRLTGRQLVEGGLGTHPVVIHGDRTLTANPLYRGRPQAR